MAHGFKSGGRVRGTPNKATVANREKLQQLFDALLNSVTEEEMLKLPVEQRLYFAVKLSPYLVPKASDENTTAAEEEVKEYTPHITQRVQFKEAVEQARKDPEEMEMANLFYPPKDEPGQTKLPEILRLPAITVNDSMRYAREDLTREKLGEARFARLLSYNIKNAERWEQEDNERARLAWENAIQVGNLTGHSAKPP